MRKHFALPAGIALALGLATVAAGPASGDDRRKPKPKTTQVQILGLNDFHGALEPPSGSAGRIGVTNAGGVAHLAAHVRALRATNPDNTVFVSAGDLIGATPLVSAIFHDEPSIEAMNLIGLDYNGVGNHEFDEGVYELLRMRYGGCHPFDGCQDGDAFAGSDFEFLAANVKWKQTGQPIFPAYKIHKFEDVDVAFIGMTLEGTPNIVSQSGIASVDFLDEAETVNRLVPRLKRQGIETIVVLLHEGGAVSDAGNGVGSETTINNCNNPSGALPPIVAAMSDEVDVVVTGHTNWAVNCIIDGKIVTGAGSNGRLITDIDLTINKKSRDVVSATVNNKIVTRDVVADDLSALVTKYKTLSAPFANRVIGKITADILRAQNPAGESALGDVIADAQLAGSAGAGAQIAFMNAGGIRADLLFANSPGGEAPGEVTFGESFSVQPFGNALVTMTLTGAQIDALLEKQFDGGIGILQVSAGFSYTRTESAPVGSKVSNITLNGVPVDPAASYRVTVNSFLADGGDNYTILRDGTNRVGGDVDTDALEKYFQANPAGVSPPPLNRIVLVP